MTLDICCGSKQGASLSVRHGVDRALVRTISKNRSADSIRVFVIERASDEAVQRIDFEGFYVQGAFRIVEKINNPRRAIEVWKTFKG